MIANSLITIHQTPKGGRKIALFSVISIVLHLLALSYWNDPRLFDIGGQQQNRYAINIALAAPKQQKEAVREGVAENGVTPEQRPVKPAKRHRPEVGSVATPVITRNEETTVIPNQEKAIPPTAVPPERVQEPIHQGEKIAVPASRQTQPATSRETQEYVEEALETDAPPPHREQPAIEKVEPSEQHPVQPENRQQESLAPPGEVDTTPVATAKKNIVQPSRPTAPSETQSRAMIRRLIQAELQTHFQYPGIARRKGWQGKVTVEFTVMPNGLLSNINIKKGSRYGILNRSAVDTMLKIHRLTKITPGTLVSPIRMELPIIYQLRNH